MANKSITKRIKITRNKKFLARKPGKDHFNAKESRAKQLTGKRMADFPVSAKTLYRYLNK
jgi:ribosomal protein L35